ncbi:MAG: DUF4261 domain-containing protein [Hyphomicrobiaceae bacterium]
MSDETTPIGDDIILCVPGLWEDRSAFLAALLESSGGRFIAAGGLLLETETKESAGFQFEETANAHLSQAFGHAAMDQLSEDTMASLAAHKSVLYLLMSYDGPASHDGIRLISKAVHEAGGLAVKIETAGLAFEFDNWLQAIEHDIPAVWYENFVCHLAQDNDGTSMRSVGMQQFSLPEAAIDGHDDLEEASQILMIFNVYQMCERPELAQGQTFSTTEDGPVWTLSHTKDANYDNDDLFYNSEGVWQLTKAA